MAIKIIRKIEDNGVKVFDDEKSLKHYLDCVSATSSFSWYNSMLLFSSNKKPRRINTADSWTKEGHTVKRDAQPFTILIPKYKTEFIDTENGEAVDVETLSSDELAAALQNNILLKRSYIYDFKHVDVYTEHDTEGGKEDYAAEKMKSPASIQSIINVLSVKYGADAEGLQKTIAVAVTNLVNRMRLSKDPEALNTRTFEKTIIVSCVTYIVLKYLGVDYDKVDFRFLENWRSGINKKKDNNIIKIRCLNRISVVAGGLIKDINDTVGVQYGTDESLIDKNYKLSDIIKAAEADYINTMVHKAK